MIRDTDFGKEKDTDTRSLRSSQRLEQAETHTVVHS